MYYYCVYIYTHVCCGIRVCASIGTCVCGESMCVYVVCVCIGERTWCVSARVCMCGIRESVRVRDVRVRAHERAASMCVF